MGRAGIEPALPGGSESTVWELHNTVWSQPIIVTGNLEVSIALWANDDQQIDFEIYSRYADQKIIHCQGRAAYTPRPSPGRIDVERLRKETQAGQLQPEGVYATF